MADKFFRRGVLLSKQLLKQSTSKASDYALTRLLGVRESDDFLLKE